jgi:hypothetical protein
MATLGELLFYVATQQQDGGGASVEDTSAAWGINRDTIAAVGRLLRAGEDEVVQHYAVKTIENICSQGGEWAGLFAHQVRGGQGCGGAGLVCSSARACKPGRRTLTHARTRMRGRLRRRAARTCWLGWWASSAAAPRRT